MIKKIFTCIIFLLCFPICQLKGENCYSEYWQKLFWKMWENDSLALSTYVKIDTGNHLKSIRALQINEQLSWKASENFSLELHYAYIHEHSLISNSPWRWHHRLEFEANRTFLLSCNYLVDTRNRLEVIRIQAEPKTQYRLRQRTMFVIPFEGKGIFKSFSLYNELFYNVSTHLFSQDRICPFQITIAISDKIDMDLFFLVRFFISEDIWRKSVVFGTQFSF